MTTDTTEAGEGQRPAFTHQRTRHGLIGPFSGRQLLIGALAVLVIAIVGVAVTTPLGNTANDPNLVDPLATPFLIGEPPPEGLKVGQQAPDLMIDQGGGTVSVLQDLDGNPVTLASLRGKVVWLNFFASWCPPCQQETPILRSFADTYRDRGLEVVGISVQETTPADVKAYAARYQLRYPIGFDGSGDVLREYRVFALPTQFFIDTNGVIQTIVSGPVDEQGAKALIESMLPAAGATSGMPSGS